MNKFLFVLRTFNDIDHIAPLIWKCINNNNFPLIIFNSNYDYNSDLRIKFLIRTGNVKIISMPDHLHDSNYNHLGSNKKINFFKKITNKIYNQFRKPRSIPGKMYRKLFFDCSKEYNLLKSNNITAAVFEWGNPMMKGEVFEKIFKASKGLGIPTFSIPHGLNIYTNSDLHQDYITNLKRGILPNFSSWNQYDHIIVQTKYHQEHLIRFGLLRSKLHVWGSLRFCSSWQIINSKIHKKFTSKNDSVDKVKVVIMMPHWNYNIKKNETINLIKEIMKLKNIYLIVKDHTRGDTGSFPENEKNELSIKTNIEFDTSSSSTSLIDWSDLIINFGSSIGIEAIDKDKPVIYPKYLHSNKSIHDYINVTYNASNSGEVIEIIENLKINSFEPVKKENKDRFMSIMVYGGKEPHNVIDYYYNKMINFISIF